MSFTLQVKDYLGSVADRGFTNRRQGRGAAGAEGVWCGEETMPPPHKKIDFGSQNGDFRCILGTIFTVQLFGLNAKSNAVWLGKLDVACTQRVKGIKTSLLKSVFDNFHNSDYLTYRKPDGRLERRRGHGPPRPLNPPLFRIESKSFSAY